MSKTLKDVLNNYDLLSHPNPYTGKILSRISICRSSQMGYHYYKCDNPECCHVHYQYHGCGNRHCPQCNWLKQQQWKEARINELLPVKYFHVVFTLPHELNSIIAGNRVVMFNLLFKSASNTLLTLCKDPKWLGATPSISIVLHTWGQQLSFHTHVHCIVSGGGVDKDLNWVDLKKKTHKGYLLPYEVIEPFFKKCFLRNLNRMINSNQVKIDNKTNWKHLKNKLYDKQWIVYAKPPMGSVQQVIEYLAQYCNKVAISNHRILEVNTNEVLFQYKDRNKNGKKRQIRLSTGEFVRRFEQHILPHRFVKIRHYGILANNNRKTRINKILEKMKLPKHAPTVKIPYHVRLMELYGFDVNKCPKCNEGKLILIDEVYPSCRGSPAINRFKSKKDLSD